MAPACVAVLMPATRGSWYPMADPDNKPRVWSRLIPAATFLVGLLVGALVVLANQSGTPSTKQPPKSPSATSPSPGESLVTVPAACQQASDNIQQATSLLRDTVSSIKNFNPKELVRLLNQLEDLDQATRPLARECSQVKVTVGPTPSTSISPSASPSASPSGSPS